MPAIDRNTQKGTGDFRMYDRWHWMIIIMLAPVFFVVMAAERTNGTVHRRVAHDRSRLGNHAYLCYNELTIPL